MDKEAIPLVRFESNDSTPDSDTRRLPEARTRRIIVEPVFFLFSLAVVGEAPVLEQYVYSRFKLDSPLFNESINRNSTFCQTNHSDPEFIAMESVQKQTSHFQMALNLVCSSLAMVTTLVYGTYSDSAGRKVVLILSIMARAIKFVFTSFVIGFKLPVQWLLPGEILVGLGGGYATMVMGVNSYLSETTATDTRTFRMAVLETCLAVAVSISELGLGYFVEKLGFLYPTLTLLGILVIDLIYVWLFVPETRPSRKVLRSPRQSFIAFCAVYTQREGKRRIKLMLLNIMTLTFLMGCGGASVGLLFMMNTPLCWGPVQMGIYLAISSLVSQFVGLFALKVFKKFEVSEITVAAIGTVSAIVGNVLHAWAATTFIMYTVFFVAMLMVLPLPVIRSIISRQVKPEEQGTVFAGVASIQSLSSLMVGGIFMYIYKNTLVFMPGFVFIVSALFGVITIALILTYIYVCRLADEMDERKPLQHDWTNCS
ncbi:lysosomal proton-coupled steroid conjugate and bile acid symporter SLC46A3-like [Lineus longissimus]|uniref:lysosomal proton-coupled steroid conjugate and bile acid symporter SLC46A3-like n=1 Tax=Lineus longissimus TaxID=88925 RepID=UPI00315CC0EA